VRSDAEVSLVVCEDFTGTTFLNRDGQASGGGHLGVQHLAVRSIEGTLKIYDSVGGGNSCPIA